MANPIPSWKTSFQGLTDRGAGALRTFGELNPRLFVGALAAGLAAPLVMKNDERGYTKTAMITTPAIISAALLVPRIKTKVADESKRLIDVVRKVPTDYGFRSGGDLGEAAAAGRVSPELRNRSLAKYLAGFDAQEVTPEMLSNEYNSLIKQIDRLYDPESVFYDQAKHTLVDDALWHATRGHLSAVDIADVGKGMMAMAPQMERADVDALISAHQDNISWIREMNYRMQDIHSARMAKAGTVVKQVGDLESDVAHLENFAYSKTGRAKLLESDPEWAKRIDSLLQDKSVTQTYPFLKGGNIRVVTLPAANKPYGEIRGIQVVNGNKILSIGLPGPNGVFTGSNFEHNGVSRLFSHKGRDIPSHYYITEALREGYDKADEARSIGQFLLGRDPGDEWSTSVGAGVPQATSRQQTLVGTQVVMGDLENSFPQGPFSAMEPTEQMATLRDKFEQGYVKLIGGNNHAIIQTPEARLVATAGLPGSQEELITKAGKSAFYADVAEAPLDPKEKVLSRPWGFSTTDAVDVPNFSTRTYQASAHEQQVFGYMPEWNQFSDNYYKVLNQIQARNPEGLSATLKAEAERISFEYAYNQGGHKSRFIERVMKAQGADRETAEQLFNKMVPFLAGSEGDNYEAMRRAFSYLGDGSRVGRKSIAVNAARKASYTVSKAGLSEDLMDSGRVFRRGQYIGTSAEGNLIKASARFNKVIGRSVNEGSLTYHLLEFDSLEGLKAHGGTGKFIFSQAMRDRDFDKAIRGINLWGKATGAGGFVPKEVNSIGLYQYGTMKPKDPTALLNDMLGDVITRFQDVDRHNNGQTSHAIDLLKAQDRHGQTYAQRMNELGYTFNDKSQLVLKSSGFYSQNRSALKVQEVTAFVKEMMDEAGARVYGGMAKGNQFFDSYREYHDMYGGSLADFMEKYAMPETNYVSNHANFNHGGQTTFTGDAEQDLLSMGHADFVQQIHSRSDMDGNRAAAWEYGNMTEPNVRTQTLSTRPEGANIISFEDSGIGLDLRLNSADGRVRHTPNGNGISYKTTVFDPKNPLTQDNFFIEADVRGRGKTYIPVPGRQTYGGKANAHPGGFSATDWEKNLNNLGKTVEEINAGYADPTAFDSAANTFMDSYRNEFLIGKKSALRASVIDKEGIQGVLAARSSTALHAEGSINHFQIGIGDELLKELPREHRNALLAGKPVYGALISHPIKSIPIVQAVYDPNLSGKSFGIDPVVAAENLRDFDGDLGFFHPASGGVAERLKAFHEDQNSLQNLRMKHRRIFGGEDFDPFQFHENVESGVEVENDLFRQARRFAEANGTSVDNLMARTAGSPVGMLSNTSDLIKASLESNKFFTNPADRLLAEDTSFDLIRQVSIAAMKLKKGSGFEDAADIIAWNSELRSGLFKGELGVDKFRDTLMRSAQTFGKERQVTAEDIHFFGLDPSAEGGMFNPYTTLFERRPELVENIARGFMDKDQTNLVRLMQMNKEAANGHTGPITSLLKPGSMPGREAKVLGRTGAEMAADAAGALNSDVSGSIGKIKQFAGRGVEAAEGVASQVLHSVEEIRGAARGSGAGKVLGIGAALATGAGILFGSIHSPREGQALAPSGNSFRPEETAGTGGAEPDAGSMAPSNPPRRVRSSPAGVRTAVMAPIARTSELEVHMKADDRGTAAEVSKMAAKMAGGNQNIHLTYRDTTRLDSLRTREKVREAMDES